MKRLLGLFALLALSACQSTPLAREESPYYTVPAGSRLILHKDLTIPAERAGVYIQGGMVMGWTEINSYHPHCNLVMRRVADAPQTVRAGEFVVVKVRRQNLSAVRPGAQYAQLFADGVPSHWVYATVMDLRSTDQPEVISLTCQHWESPPPAPQHLTIRQIRAALGELFTLKLPDTK